MNKYLSTLFTFDDPPIVSLKDDVEQIMQYLNYPC